MGSHHKVHEPHRVLNILFAKDIVGKAGVIPRNVSVVEGSASIRVAFCGKAKPVSSLFRSSSTLQEVTLTMKYFLMVTFST